MSESLQHWQPATTPDNRTLEGLYIRLEKLDPVRHGDDLWLALQGPDSDPKLWDYLPYGPFPERSAFDAWLEKMPPVPTRISMPSSTVPPIRRRAC